MKFYNSHSARLAVALFVSATCPPVFSDEVAPTKACLAGKKSVDLSYQFPKPRFQGDTGTCYLFGTCGILEAAETRHTGKKPRALSESYLAMKTFKHDFTILADEVRDYWDGKADGILSSGHHQIYLKAATSIGKLPSSLNPEKESTKLEQLNRSFATIRDANELSKEVDNAISNMSTDIKWDENSNFDFSKVKIKTVFDKNSAPEVISFSARYQDLLSAQASLDTFVRTNNNHLDKRIAFHENEIKNPPKNISDASEELENLKKFTLEEFVKWSYKDDPENTPSKKQIDSYRPVLEDDHAKNIASHEKYLATFNNGIKEKIDRLETEKSVLRLLPKEAIDLVNMDYPEFKKEADSWADRYCQKGVTLYSDLIDCKATFFTHFYNYRTSLRLYHLNKKTKEEGSPSPIKKLPPETPDINHPGLKIPKDFSTTKELAMLREECDKSGKDVVKSLLANLCQEQPLVVSMLASGTAQRKENNQWVLVGNSTKNTPLKYTGHGLIIQGYDYDPKTGEGFFIFRNSWESAPQLRLPAKDACLVYEATRAIGPKDPGAWNAPKRSLKRIPANPPHRTQHAQ